MAARQPKSSTSHFSLGTSHFFMFITHTIAKKETVESRDHVFHSLPGFTPTEDLLFVHVTIPPGGGHSFHNHPNKEEVIYILEGEAEQWLEHEKQTIGPAPQSSSRRAPSTPPSTAPTRI